MVQNSQGKAATTQRRSWRYWVKLLAIGLVWGLVLFSVGYVKLYVDVLTCPMRASICCTTPADLGFDYEEATFTTTDGVALSGWYIPSQNGASIILLHGDGGNRMGMMSHAKVLARHGYGVLLYDQRACGESEGDMRTYGWLDAGDVLSAVEYLQTRDDTEPDRIGVLGVSLGGQIAIRAAAETEESKAVVADGSGTAVAQDIPITAEYLRYFVFNWAVDRVQELQTGVPAPRAVVEVIGDIAPRPILLIAAGESVRVEGWESDYNQRLYDAAGEPKTLWEIPEAGHGGGLAARPEEYEERIVAFFNAALLSE